MTSLTLGLAMIFFGSDTKSKPTKSKNKKSIDLEYASWLSLSKYAKSQGITLSEAVNQLIDEVENQDIYREQIAKMKSSISELLK